MHHVTTDSHLPPASRWFVWAAGLLLLFFLCTFLLTTGIFDAATAQVEQWLLQRPITGLDCTFYEWRNLGEPLVIGGLLFVVGVICLRLGYRWPVLPFLLVLLLLELVGEVIGKAHLTQPIPHSLGTGMTILNCPQIRGQPHSVRLSAALGLWWNIPPISQPLLQQVQMLSHLPFASEGYDLATGYPGGHAMRWSFLGGVVCWLCWRHIRQPRLRIPSMLLALLVAFGGGFFQFYVGAHLITDTIAGYLLGSAAACCAIGLLLLNEPRKSVAFSPPS